MVSRRAPQPSATRRAALFRAIAIRGAAHPFPVQTPVDTGDSRFERKIAERFGHALLELPVTGAAGTLDMQGYRYTGFAQALHWLTAGLLCFLLPFVWVSENFPPGDERTFWYMLHESVGITVFLLVLLRLTWRWRHRAPGYPPGTRRAMRLVAHLNHGLLYAILLLMPITGYLMAGNGQNVVFYGFTALPGFERHDALGILANRVHVWTQFALYALVILHVAATVWHVAIRRDGLLERMLPEQRPAQASRDDPDPTDERHHKG